MIKVANHPMVEQAFDGGVAYGIRMTMARFAAAFYTFDNADETIWNLGQELMEKYDKEGKAGKVSDEEFSYELFALLAERYGPPKLQPRPEFKPFEGNAPNIPKVAVKIPIDPPKQGKPAKKKAANKKKPNSH